MEPPSTWRSDDTHMEGVDEAGERGELILGGAIAGEVRAIKIAWQG